MTSAPARSGVLAAVALAVRVCCPLAFGALLALGRFSDIGAYGPLQWGGLALMAALFGFELFLAFSLRTITRASGFSLALVTTLAVKAAALAGLAAETDLFPLVLLAFTAAAGYAGILRAAALLAIYAGLETASAFLGSGSPPDWTVLALRAAAMAGFGIMVTGLVRLERIKGSLAEDKLAKIQKGATEFQRDDTVHRLSGLSDKGRHKESIRRVIDLDQKFYSELEEARAALKADACVLYWRAEPDEDFHFREASSQREELSDAAMLPKDGGTLARAALDGKTISFSGAKNLKGKIPYLSSGNSAEHFIAGPVIDEDWVQGVLAADRSSGGPFTRNDEKVLAAIARNVKEIHSHALLIKRSEVEAAQFKSLAQLGGRLSRSLDLAEIMEAVERTAGAITNQDALVVIEGSLEGEPRVIHAAGEVGEGLAGGTIDQDLSLAGEVIRKSRYKVVKDLEAFSPVRPVLGPGMDPPGMRSALIHPLPFASGKPGALALFSKRPDAFGAYVAGVTGVLADMASVSVRNAALYREMAKKAVTDGLTGLHNHRWFQERLEEEIERAERLGSRLAVVMADVDHFKKVNDAHGHPVGDEVLKAVSGLLKRTARKVDAAARYGGEEFVVILVGTDGQGALEFAERVRKGVSKLAFDTGETRFKVTLSLGVSVYPDDAQAKDRLIELADQALYQAKESGRNRTIRTGKG